MTLPWAKVFRDKLRGSIRIRSLKLTDYGVYMHVMMAAGDDGALVSGTHAWTLEDIALECNAPRGKKRIAKAVERLVADGLLQQREGGAYVVTNWAEMQTSHRAVRHKPPVRRQPRRGPRPIASDLGDWGGGQAAQIP